MQVHVQQADIASMAVDAVVNPANSLGIMGEGIAAALHRHGGATIQAEAMSAAPIAVGAAVVTKAGTLSARHVIHAPTMNEPGLRIGAEHVRRAARAALLAANLQKFEIVAFPGMGTDVGGVESSEAARAIVEELRAHKHPFPQTVYLVAPTREMVEAFEAALENAQYLG